MFVGGLVFLAGAGWIAELVASLILFSVAAWIVAVIVLIILIVLYFRAFGDAVSRGDLAHVFDLIAAPIFMSLLGFLVAKLEPVDLSNVHGFAEVVIVLFGLYGNWIAPFTGPYLVSSRDRRLRALAYPTFFLLSYIWVSVIVVYHLW